MSDTLICFDLDGTLSKQEILPRIAELADISEEIAALTQATIQGVIPFEMSFKLRVRLLRDICPRKISDYVAETVELDERILRYIRNGSGADCVVVTGNLDCWIEGLVRRIGVPYVSSLGEVKNGRLLGVANVLRKDAPVAQFRRDYRRIIAVGDGENDIPLFRQADVGIAYGGVHAPSANLANMADYIVYSSEALCDLLSMQ
ncbi:HAD-IB family phosphatase [Burkholderia pseudomallei]|uniref:phosphoserine phosphatase n=1 Tax=Burkholderia pseudomallei TaxID=28450 RepID=A3FII3_BURPE|nr:HAD family phosphatase [Burkholderia pseudomallei]ABN48667.1 phosphoserine phosphatase [Burkholderia pseudomallei]ABN85959.1 HAD-superfamily hydrolase, subfamily IB [Burkholderia pseudomallei 668]AGR67676.1 HAD phosphoserine phosphatase-like hydrolase, IB family protein [Burkholderia pseudomallei MSHR305]AGZ30396.1 HAD-SF-IB: HAD phosphoserine phosphatase-like hydrolase, IB family protein [Burkholderia pseudomallei NCTC 13179]AHE31350.1 HAD phosphoserine phosphatase-like hydrolase, IB famil